MARQPQGHQEARVRVGRLQKSCTYHTEFNEYSRDLISVCCVLVLVSICIHKGLNPVASDVDVVIIGLPGCDEQ